MIIISNGIQDNLVQSSLISYDLKKWFFAILLSLGNH